MSTPRTEPDRAAEELRLLALGLLDRAGPGIRTLLALLRERAEQAPAVEHSAVCAWCPLCATVGLLRGERPELADTIAQHASGLVAALRVLLTPPPAGPGSPTGPAGPDLPPEPPAAQHIEVRRAGEAGAGC